MQRFLTLFFNANRFFIIYEKQKSLYNKSTKYDYLLKISEKQKMKRKNHNEKQNKLHNKNNVSLSDVCKYHKVGSLTQCTHIGIKNIFSKCKRGLDMDIYRGILYFDRFDEL